MRGINLFFGVLASKLVRGYQLFISPLLPPSCRYYPTCSEYSRVSFIRHGFIKGLYLTVYRILRCNPWSRGGYDPVPPLRGADPDFPNYYEKKGESGCEHKSEN